MADADVLFAAHQQGVFRYLCSLVGESDTARDLTQEVFLRVARAPVPTDDANGRRAWVFKIARNLGLNYLRDRGRRLDTAPLADADQPAVQELRLALDRAVAGLADLDRDVFTLRESVGLTYAEVAVACDISVEGVRARLHRARLQLRDTLGPALSARQTMRGVRLVREGRNGHDGHDD